MLRDGIPSHKGIAGTGGKDLIKNDFYCFGNVFEFKKGAPTGGQWCYDRGNMLRKFEALISQLDGPKKILAIHAKLRAQMQRLD